MTWINSQFTFADAVARSQDVWELLVDNWGNSDDPSADGSSLIFPPFPAGRTGPPGLPSCAAVAIGPRSTVDRTWIGWNLAKIVKDTDLWDYPRRLSVGSPLGFAQPGNEGEVTTVSLDSDAGSVTVYSSVATPVGYYPGLMDSTLFSNLYTKLNGATHTFGEDAIVTKGGGLPSVPAYWVSPFLHLVFYLRSQPVQVPTKRFPFTLRRTIDSGVNGTEQMVAQIPIFGRKTVTVQVTPNSVNSDVRLSVLRVIPTVSFPAPVNTLHPQEQTVYTAAAVPADTQTTVTLTNLFADYLLVHTNPASGNQSKALLTVYATD